MAGWHACGVAEWIRWLLPPKGCGADEDRSASGGGESGGGGGSSCGSEKRSRRGRPSRRPPSQPASGSGVALPGPAAAQLRHGGAAWGGDLATPAGSGPLMRESGCVRARAPPAASAACEVVRPQVRGCAIGGSGRDGGGSWCDRDGTADLPRRRRLARMRWQTLQQRLPAPCALPARLLAHTRRSHTSTSSHGHCKRQMVPRKCASHPPAPAPSRCS